MPICGTKTQMPGHRRSGSRRSSSLGSPDMGAASRPTSMRISTMETEKVSHRRRSRSPRPSSSRRFKSPRPLRPAWVILNRIGARRDCFHGDITTSDISHTSTGEQISVSFELVEPPETSLLVLDWPQGPGPMDSTLSYPNVISSHRNAVLFEMTSRAKYPFASIDYFVYGASSEPSKRPSLSRLPICYWKGPSSTDPPRPRIHIREATGILSISERPFSFQVIELEGRMDSLSCMDMYMFCSEAKEWKVFEGIRVHGSRDGSDLCWWSTDAVLPRCGNQLIWVDYYRGMIVGSMRGFAKEPYLQYIALPIDPVLDDPYIGDYGRGYPDVSRSLCVTWEQLIKFISVDQHSSGFSITMWSWTATHHTWTEEMTMDSSQFWALDPENRLPRIQPEIPVINMMRSNTVSFLLNEGHHTTWIIEVNMEHQRLLGATPCSMEKKHQHPFLTARMMSMGLSFIFSDMPSYLLRKSAKPED